MLIALAYIYIIYICKVAQTLQVTQFTFTLVDGLVLYHQNCWVCTNSFLSEPGYIKVQNTDLSKQRKIKM